MFLKTNGSLDIKPNQNDYIYIEQDHHPDNNGLIKPSKRTYSPSLNYEYPAW